jgi:hypothetical protein
VIDTNPLSYVVKEGRSRSRDHQGEQCPEGRALTAGCFNLQVLCSGAGAVLCRIILRALTLLCPHQDQARREISASMLHEGLFSML